MYCSLNAQDGYARIGISSAGFNVMNFILFDILFAALLFYLTSVIAGLVNCLAAVKGVKNRISAYETAWVGPGLTCTSCNAFRILAVARYVMMILVFATNFLVEGASCQAERIERQKVLVPGDLSRSYSLDLEEAGNIRSLSLRRHGCKGIRSDNFTYYGEFRLGGRCELREKLMASPPVTFGRDVVDRAIQIPQPCTRKSNHTRENRYDCPGLGTIFCFHMKNDNVHTCYSVVNLPDKNEGQVGQMCTSIGGEGEHLHLRNNLADGLQNKTRPTRIAQCRAAINIDVTKTAWANIAMLMSFKFDAIVDAVYGPDFREMDVKVVSQDNTKQVTDVHFMWFVLLGVTIFMILLLSIISIWFRTKGFVAAANSEPRIGTLILNFYMYNNISQGWTRDEEEAHTKKPGIHISLSPDGIPYLHT